MRSTTPDKRCWKPCVVAIALAGGGVAAFGQGAAPSNPLDQLPLPRAATSPGGGTELHVTPPPATPQGVLAAEITPQRFDVQGVKSVPFAEVAALFQPLVGQKVTVAAIVAKAREATALYKEAGWGLSFVYVPAQSFADGVVRIVAVEGHVTQVRIEGDAGRSRERLEAIAAHIVAEKPLRTVTFERYAALLGRLPGMTVDAQVPLPAATDGASTMTLKVARKPVDASVAADLRKPRPRAIVTATLNDVVTPGSELSVAALVPGSHEQLRSLQFRQAVGSEGLMVKAAVSTYRGDPDDAIGFEGPLERRNINVRRELSASYPLQLAARSALMLSGGVYSVNNIDTSTDPATGNFLSDQARVRAGFVQLNWNRDEPTRSSAAQVLLAHGFDTAGAQTALVTNVPGVVATTAARADFTRVAAEAREARRFSSQWGGAVSAALQWSPHTLPATERVSYGGSRYARGYAAGETSGDQGWGVGVELNRTFAMDAGRARQLQPYVLVEVARIYGHTVTPVPAKLASLALGLRVADLKHYMVDLSVAKPVGDRPLENASRSPRAVLQFSWKL